MEADTLTEAAPEPGVRPRRYHVLVNATAGAALEIGAPALRARVEAAFAAAGAEAELHLGPIPELDARLRALDDPDAIPVIVGGDGTVLALMPALLERGLPFSLLPMGTMNLLGRDLGLVGDLDADVLALHTGSVRAVDMPTLNGAPFHSVSGLGFAVAVASERERARHRIPFSRALATVVAAVLALVRNRPVEVEVEAAGRTERLKADAVLVTNNLFQGSPWRRPRLDEGLLEVHLLAAPTVLARSQAALAVMTGEWRALRHLTSLRATRVTLRRPRSRGPLRVTMDGEITRQPGELRYAIVPGALKILAANPIVAEIEGLEMSDREAVGL